MKKSRKLPAVLLAALLIVAFVALFFAVEKRLAELTEKLMTMTSQWKGKLVDSVSVSVGYV